jgi:hypothetical protein
MRPAALLSPRDPDPLADCGPCPRSDPTAPACGSPGTRPPLSSGSPLTARVTASTPPSASPMSSPCPAARRTRWTSRGWPATVPTCERLVHTVAGASGSRPSMGLRGPVLRGWLCWWSCGHRVTRWETCLSKPHWMTTARSTEPTSSTSTGSAWLPCRCIVRYGGVSVLDFWCSPSAPVHSFQTLRRPQHLTASCRSTSVIAVNGLLHRAGDSSSR